MTPTAKKQTTAALTAMDRTCSIVTHLPTRGGVDCLVCDRMLITVMLLLML
jgi:hypothetical protein